MHEPSDMALVAGLAAGREDAYAALYDRFAARLLAAAWGMLGSRDAAEDAVQDVFVNLVKSRASLAGVRDLQAYLFTSLRHAAARRAQRPERREQSLEEARDVSAQVQAADDPATVERDPRLEHALAALPREQREVVALRIDGGLTLAEAAAVLGISPNTAASRYRYALEKLRERLAP